MELQNTSDFPILMEKKVRGNHLYRSLLFIHDHLHCSLDPCSCCSLNSNILDMKIDKKKKINKNKNELLLFKLEIFFSGRGRHD